MIRSHSPSVWRRVTAVVLGLAVGGVGLALSFRGVSWPGVMEALAHVRGGWLAAALLSSAGVGVLKAARWYRLFVPDQRGLEFLAVGTTLIVAQMINVVVPIHGGGEALRIGLIARRFPLSALRVSGTIVLEKLLDAASLGLLALAAAPVTAQHVGSPALSRLALAVAAGVLLASALAMRYRNPIRRRLSGWPRIAGWVDQVLSGFNALESGNLAWEPVMWTALVRCLSLVSLAAALQSMGLSVPLLGIVALDVLLNVSYLLPTPPALIGLVQYVTVLALGFFGIAGAPTVGAGIVVHLTVLAPYLLFGLPAGVYVWSFSLRRGSLGLPVDEGR